MGCLEGRILMVRNSRCTHIIDTEVFLKKRLFFTNEISRMRQKSTKKFGENEVLFGRLSYFLTEIARFVLRIALERAIDDMRSS